jgi:hypothetical protein
MEEAYSVQQTSDGGFVIAGKSRSHDGDLDINFGLGDCWILKLDSTGSIQWSKIYGGSDWDYAYDIKQTTDGGFIVVGASASDDNCVSGNHGYNDYWVLRLDNNGDTLWTKCYGGSKDDYAYAVEQTVDGGFIVSGYSYSTDGDVSGNHGGSDLWILRLDANGNILWSKCYGGSSSEYAYGIQQTADGDHY